VIRDLDEFPELTIGEVARRAGVATSSIRYYERIDLLPPPERVGGQRRYRTDVLGKLGTGDPDLALTLVQVEGSDCRRPAAGGA
jgi:hypothetical protein